MKCTHTKPKGSLCQSCAMPMQKEKDFGTNKDKSKNQMYCCYCFQCGQFTDSNMTMEQMTTKVSGIMKQMKIPEAQIEHAKKILPTLKRWKKCGCA